MLSHIRIHRSSRIGAIILFGFRNSLVIFLFLSLLTITVAKSSKSFNLIINDLALNITKPIFYVSSSPIDLFFFSKNKISNLIMIYRQNDILKKDNKILRDRLAQITYLEEENKILQNLLENSPKKDAAFITSKIFIQNYDNFTNIAIIDRGSENNLANGMAVITTDGLVGRILKTSENYAHILLINDFNSRIPIYSSKSREKAIMVGNHDSYPTLKYLNHTHKIENNEIIYSSGDGIMYPADIPIGVTVINSKNEIEVIPFAEFNNLQFVKVIL